MHQGARAAVEAAVNAVPRQTSESGNRRRVRTPDRRNDLTRRPAAAERLVERYKTARHRQGCPEPPAEP